MMEILAPAGGREQLIAAVRCGADAVYLGAKGFNARRNAANFDDNELEESVKYCHQRGVKVYVTINTLVMDDEMDKLYATCDEVAACGVDGVIIQDLAVNAYFREHYPTLRRISSTQMAIHNVQGARALKEMGYDRMVLARETTLAEMKKINEAGVEMEAFVHGALCVCLSGACYFSSMLGGRSGNRGLCAQPCRLNFKCRGREYALSLKDLSYLERLPELEAAGVKSLKIEGRMKRPEYVAAAVTACRAALDGKKVDMETLKSVFSRSGFTQNYLDGKRNLDMYGTRRKEDVEAAGKVLGELAGLYRAERASLPVKLQLRIMKNQAELYGESGEYRAKAAGGTPFLAEKDLDPSRQLTKTGGTPFYVEELSVDNPHGLSLRAAEVNDLRRQVLDALMKERGLLRGHEKKETLDCAHERGHKKTEVCKTGEWWGRFACGEQVCCEEDFGRIILPLEEIRGIPWEKAVCELPAVLFPEDEERYVARLKTLKEQGLRAVYAENMYGVHLGKTLGLEVLGGAGLNILNAKAMAEYRDLGLDAATVSFECSMKKADEMDKCLPSGLIAYGRLPLMRMRNCPGRGKNGCGDCKGRYELTDDKGARFPVICAGRKYVSVHNSVPLHIADKRMAKMDFYTLYFTTESREESEKILRDYQEKRGSLENRTGGLYYRTLL